jgi:transcriptional regulator with XRE-family HTH domain
MATRIATESCAIKPVSHLILGCDIADTLQPMVATQETDNAGFVARLNEALDGIKDVPRARGRRIALAKMMGMSGESARKWLAGETLPSMDNARQFAAKAGVQVDWLLTGRGPKLPATIEATAKVQVPADDLPLTASGYIEVMPGPATAVAAVLSSDEIEWLQLYHELPPEQREAIKTIAGKTSQKKE